MSDSASVFISYSTKDIHFVERLRASLKTAKVPYWIDKEGLQAGTQNWEKSIRAAIRESSSVILVASPNAYESNYVQDEIAIAQMHGRMIYPVWADGEHWIACVPMGMGKTQHIDMRGERFESNFALLFKALGGANPSLAYTPPPVKPSAPGVTRRSPYKGLEAFQEKDAGDFFGRTAAINDLLSRFKERATADKGRLFAVIGASGSGKSSVVMAGLLPRLKGGALPGSEAWLYIPPITPGNAPIRALTRGLSKVFPEKPFGSIEDDLRRSNGLGLANLAYTVDQRVVLYIDQFEELFMPGVGADERDQYISLIVQAANELGGNLVVLLTLRADFYDRPTNYRELGALVSQNNYTLLPMSLTELREAIESPTQLPDVGLTFETGLVGDIVFELRESKDRMALAGALPLLQFTLQQLYEKRDQSGDTHKLTQAAYLELGGVSGAISRYAEAVFSDLDEEAQNRLGHVFFRLINVDERGEATRERAVLSDFKDDEATTNLIDALVKARLLLTNYEDSSPTVEVAHEALLRNWNRLVQWVDNEAKVKRQLQKLQRDATFWEERGKPPFRFRYTYEYELEIEALRGKWDIVFPPLLQEFLQPEIKRLIESLRGNIYKEPSVQSARARLIELGYVSVLPLLAVIEDEDSDLVANAADILGKLGDDSAVEPLINLLSHNEWSVQWNTATALGNLRDARAAEPLIRILRDTEADQDFRLVVIEALAELKDLRAVDALIETLNDRDSELRSTAANALGDLADPRAIEPLISLLEDVAVRVRMSAKDALYMMKLKSVDVLIGLLASSKEIRRQNIVELLGYLADARAEESLIALLDDPNDDLRWNVVWALGKLGGSSAILSLEKMLNDPNESVRQEATNSIRALKNKEFPNNDN